MPRSFLSKALPRPMQGSLSTKKRWLSVSSWLSATATAAISGAIALGFCIPQWTPAPVLVAPPPAPLFDQLATAANSDAVIAVRETQLKAAQEAEWKAAIASAKEEAAQRFKSASEQAAERRLANSYRENERRHHMPKGTPLFALGKGIDDAVVVLCFPDEHGYDAVVVSRDQWRQLSHLASCNVEARKGSDFVGYVGEHAVGYAVGSVPQ